MHHLLLTSLSELSSRFSRLDEIEEGSEIQGYLIDKTSQRTVPNVWISTRHNLLLTAFMIRPCPLF